MVVKGGRKTMGGEDRSQFLRDVFRVLDIESCVKWTNDTLQDICASQFFFPGGGRMGNVSAMGIHGPCRYLLVGNGPSGLGPVDYPGRSMGVSPLT